MNSKSYNKAYVLFSGGLDSYICAHMMKRYGFDVELITFKSIFFLRNLETGKSVIDVGEYKLNRIVIDVTDEYFDVLENPKYGYGKNINPCIDCKIFFLKKAKKLMEDNDVNVIATGEVLGQRPKSQRSGPLKNIKTDSGLEKHLVRPLCISSLPKSFLEDIGIIHRERFEEMMQVHGRSRKNQMEYANKYKITGFSSPSGGCLLTHKEYCRKLRPILNCGIRDKMILSLLKIGRHFLLSDDPYKTVISGRNEKENDIIENFKDKQIILRMNMDDIPGPLTLVYGERLDENDLEKACLIHTYYSDFKNNNSRAKLIDISSGKEYNILYNEDDAVSLIESMRSKH